MKTETDSLTMRVTPEMVNAFREATGDTNAIHHEHALGFQLELMLRETYKGSSKSHMKTRFRKLVPSAAELKVQIRKTDKSQVITALHVGEMALETRIDEKEMDFELPRRYVATGYKLTENDALLAGKGLGKEYPHYIGLAIGLSSKALINASYLDPVPNGKVAIYTSHELQITGEEPRNGQLIIKIGREKRKIMVSAKQDRQIYAAKLGLLYVDREKLPNP